jgi:hypothetical protein
MSRPGGIYANWPGVYVGLWSELCGLREALWGKRGLNGTPVDATSCVLSRALSVAVRGSLVEEPLRCVCTRGSVGLSGRFGSREAPPMFVDRIAAVTGEMGSWL